MIKSFFDCPSIPEAAIFMSGSGTNAEKLLESLKTSTNPAWKASVIVCDRPAKSRAREIAASHNLPLIEHDIVKFYAAKGEKSISLKSERGREIREEWTCELRKMLEKYPVSFGILAGFVPLTNITSEFPCLNVHPGDLTVEENGKRILAGLHTLPIETAILKGHDNIRSSVIIAEAYTGAGGEMDSGHIIGLSEAIRIDLQGKSIEYLKKVQESRPPEKPKGGWADELEKIAEYNQEQLKMKGDWQVFPPAVRDFASGKFGTDENKSLYYKSVNNWIPVKTVIYSNGNAEPVKSA